MLPQGLVFCGHRRAGKCSFVAGRVVGNVVSDSYVGVMTKAVDAVDSALLSGNFLFFGKDFPENLSPSRYSLHPRFRFASPRVIPSAASPRLRLGGHPPPGSASLHLGLLMVPPLRGWGGLQVTQAKRAAT